MSFLTTIVFQIIYYAAILGKNLLTKVTLHIRPTSQIKKTKLRESGYFTFSFLDSSHY